MRFSAEEFEKQVRRIVRALEDNSCSVQWSINEKDPDTGNKRQIDVLIETNDGRKFHIECRNRRAVQDVMWIEELMGRRASLKADGIVAVSASGFSKAARRKARANDIALWTLAKNEDDRFLQVVFPPKLFVLIYTNIHIDIKYRLNKEYFESNKCGIVNTFGQMALMELRDANYVFMNDVDLDIPREGSSNLSWDYTRFYRFNGHVIRKETKLTFDAKWLSLEFSGLAFSRSDGDQIYTAAEVHVADFYTMKAEVVLTREKCIIRFDMSEMNMGDGELLPNKFAGDLRGDFSKENIFFEFIPTIKGEISNRTRFDVVMDDVTSRRARSLSGLYVKPFSFIEEMHRHSFGLGDLTLTP